MNLKKLLGLLVCSSLGLTAVQAAKREVIEVSGSPEVIVVSSQSQDDFALKRADSLDLVRKRLADYERHQKEKRDEKKANKAKRRVGEKAAHPKAMVEPDPQVSGQFNVVPKDDSFDQDQKLVWKNFFDTLQDSKIEHAQAVLHINNFLDNVVANKQPVAIDIKVNDLRPFGWLVKKVKELARKARAEARKDHREHWRGQAVEWFNLCQKFLKMTPGTLGAEMLDSLEVEMDFGIGRAEDGVMVKLQKLVEDPWSGVVAWVETDTSQPSGDNKSQIEQVITGPDEILDADVQAPALASTVPDSRRTLLLHQPSAGVAAAAAQPNFSPDSAETVLVSPAHNKGASKAAEAAMVAGARKFTMASRAYDEQSILPVIRNMTDDKRAVVFIKAWEEEKEAIEKHYSKGCSLKFFFSKPTSGQKESFDVCKQLLKELHAAGKIKLLQGWQGLVDVAYRKNESHRLTPQQAEDFLNKAVDEKNPMFLDFCLEKMSFFRWLVCTINNAALAAACRGDDTRTKHDLKKAHEWLKVLELFLSYLSDEHQDRVIRNVKSRLPSDFYDTAKTLLQNFKHIEHADVIIRLEQIIPAPPAPASRAD